MVSLTKISFACFSKNVLFLALECYDLGRVAYTNGDFYHTLMWMLEALDHLDKETNKTSINKIDILDHLAYATSQVNNGIILYQENLFLFLARKC